MALSRVLILAGVVLLTGCVTGGLINTSFDSVEATPEPTAGPRPKVAVSVFRVAAPMAQQEVGDGLQDMLSMALLRTQCCQVLESDQDGDSGAEYVVVGALTEFAPSVSGMKANVPASTPLDRLSGGFASVMQQFGVQSAEAEAAQVGIDIRLIEQGSRNIRNATHVRGYAVDIDSLKFSDDSLGSGLEVYSSTPMEAAVRDAIEQAAVFVAKSAKPLH